MSIANIPAITGPRLVRGLEAEESIVSQDTAPVFAGGCDLEIGRGTGDRQS